MRRPSLSSVAAVLTITAALVVAHRLREPKQKSLSTVRHAQSHDVSAPLRSFALAPEPNDEERDRDTDSPPSRMAARGSAQIEQTRQGSKAP
ncbi:MAG: hypothetical protein ABI969_19820, partial [bacterium]